VPSTDPISNSNPDELFGCVSTVAITPTSLKLPLVRLILEKWYDCRYSHHRHRGQTTREVSRFSVWRVRIALRTGFWRARDAEMLENEDTDTEKFGKAIEVNATAPSVGLLRA